MLLMLVFLSRHRDSSEFQLSEGVEGGLMLLWLTFEEEAT